MHLKKHKKMVFSRKWGVIDINEIDVNTGKPYEKELTSITKQAKVVKVVEPEIEKPAE